MGRPGTDPASANPRSAPGANRIVTDFDFSPRTRIVFGENAVDRLGALAREYGAHRVLLVTDIAQDQPWTTLMIKKGSGKNRMQTLPEQYTYDDFQVQTEGGATVGHGDAVTVSGQYLSGCMLSVYVIE